MRFLFLLLACWSASFVVGYGQLSVDSLEQVTRVTATATVTAPALYRKLQQATGSLTQIRATELARDLALTPSAALNRVPGLTMQSGALGTHRIVMRGQGARAAFTSNRVRAYLGAIPLTDGEGNTDLEDLDLSVVDRVDVTRGPAATNYGAGLGGVLVFHPAFRNSTGRAVEVDYRGGRLGTHSAGVRVSLTPPVDSTVGGFSDAVRIGYRRTQQAGFRQNARYRRDNLTALARLSASSSGVTELQGFWTGVRGEIPSSLGATALAEDPTQAGGTWGLSEGFEAYDVLGFGVSRTQQLRPRVQLLVSAFAKTRRANEARPFDILRETTVATGTRAVLSHEAKQVSLLLGLEGFRDWYDWRTFENRFREFPAGTGSVRGVLETDWAERRTKLDAFAQATWNLGQWLGTSRPDLWQLITGLSVNRTGYELTDLRATDSLDRSGSFEYGIQVSPRLAVRYSPTGAWQVLAQVARGFSPPSVSETLRPDGSLNPDIQPETGWNVELAFRHDGNGGPFEGEFTAYLLQVDDLLVPRQLADDRFVGLNAGETRHLGLEVAGAALLIDKADQEVRLYASYTFQAHTFRRFATEDADFSGNRLTGVPRHQGALGIDLRWSHWSGHLGATGRGQLPVNDAADTFAEGYVTLGGQVSWRLSSWLHLRAGCENLLDVAFLPMVNVNAGSFGGREARYFYPGAPRSWWVGVRLGVAGSH